MSVNNSNTPGYNFSFNFCYSLTSVNSNQTIYLIIKNNYKLDYSEIFNIKKLNNLKIITIPAKSDFLYNNERPGFFRIYIFFKNSAG